MSAQVKEQGHRRYIAIPIISFLLLFTGILIEVIIVYYINIIPFSWITISWVKRLIDISGALLIGIGVFILILCSLGIIPSRQAIIKVSEKSVRAVVFVVYFFVFGSIVGILSHLSIIPGYLETIAATVLTGLVGLCTLLAIPGLTQTDTSKQNETPKSAELSTQSPSSNATTSQRIVGIGIPPTDPRKIEQREQIVKNAYELLTQKNISAVVITGIGGIGKSTLAALIYRYAEKQRLAGSGPFSEASIWLKIDSTITLNELGATILNILGKPLQDFDQLYPQNKALALLNALKTAEKARLIVLDQFDTLLDLQTGQALTNGLGIDEWIDALNSESCKCRILLTSRHVPLGTSSQSQGACLQQFPVNKLNDTEGIDLLRKLGVTQAQGTDQALRTVVEHCDGHPLSLGLLATILQDHNLSLSTLFKDHNQLWSEEIASKLLLQYIYEQQLNVYQRKLLLAFSIYREAVPKSAAKTVTDFNTKNPSHMLHALRVLVAQHLLQTPEVDRYQLHPIVAEYVQGHFVKNNQHAKKKAHSSAAIYYLQQIPPREQRRDIQDMRPLIEAAWHYCQAERWRDAYDLMEKEGLLADLNRWSQHPILLQLFELLLPLDNWQPKPSQEAIIYNNLGWVYKALGKYEQALPCFDRALQINEMLANREEQTTVLDNLGQVYYGLRDKDKALQYYKDALHISKELGNLRKSGIILNDLGLVYHSLGQNEEALKALELALRIHIDEKEIREEGITLCNLGDVYHSLGQNEEALKALERALRISGDNGVRRLEGDVLNNLGIVYTDLGLNEKKTEYFEQALSYFNIALNIRREVGNRPGEGATLNNIGLVYNVMTRNDESLKYFEDALHIHEKVRDRQEKGITLNNIGRVYYDLGQNEQALKYYREALHISREIINAIGEGRALRNIGQIYFKQSSYEVALAFFLLAKRIFEQIQNPRRNETWIDDLHKEVGEKQFTALLASVEPQAYQIVAKELLKD